MTCSFLVGLPTIKPEKEPPKVKGDFKPDPCSFSKMFIVKPLEDKHKEVRNALAHFFDDAMDYIRRWSKLVPVLGCLGGYHNYDPFFEYINPSGIGFRGPYGLPNLYSMKNATHVSFCCSDVSTTVVNISDYTKIGKVFIDCWLSSLTVEKEIFYRRICSKPFIRAVACPESSADSYDSIWSLGQVYVPVYKNILQKSYNYNWTQDQTLALLCDMTGGCREFNDIELPTNPIPTPAPIPTQLSPTSSPHPTQLSPHHNPEVGSNDNPLIGDAIFKLSTKRSITLLFIWIAALTFGLCCHCMTPK